MKKFILIICLLALPPMAVAEKEYTYRELLNYSYPLVLEVVKGIEEAEGVKYSDKEILMLLESEKFMKLLDSEYEKRGLKNPCRLQDCRLA